MSDDSATGAPRPRGRRPDLGTLRLATLLAAAAFLIDWASKSWALRHLDGTSLPLGSLVLGIARNEAFAFSAGPGGVSPELVMAVRIATLALIVVVCSRFASVLSRRHACGAALVLAGGLGNCADLVFRGGAVVDFVGAGPFSFAWAGEPLQMHLVFNAADVFILVGIGLLAPLIQELARATQRRLAAWESRVLARGASSS